MEVEPSRMCELLVGLGGVDVLGVDDVEGEPLRVHVRCRSPRPVCEGCGFMASGLLGWLVCFRLVR